jgi:hypothetical protein
MQGMLLVGCMTDATVQRIGTGRLKPEEVPAVATELQRLGVSTAAAILFRLLGSAPPAATAANVFDLFGELATREPEWIGVLERSIRRHGRCPRQFRSQMRTLLSLEGSRFAVAAKTFSEVLAADAFADLETVTEERTTVDYLAGATVRYTTASFFSGKRRATVQVTTELTDIRRMEALAALLGRIEPGIRELVLDFANVGHVYVVGLAALSAWCSHHDIHPTIVNASGPTERYLEAVGFVRASDGTKLGGTDVSPYHTLAIERITEASKPEQLAARLVDIITHHMPVSQRNRSGLIVMFAELIENVHRHAGPEPPALACAQVYPKKNKLTICIVDAGIGIRESILSGSDPLLAQRVAHGESPLKLAVTPLVTSKPGKHSGYGLYVASELTVRNGGTFRLFSGPEVLTLCKKRDRRLEYRDQLSRTPGWNGTWIAILLDLNSVVPILDVYNALPAIEGAPTEDFF